ncbi:MAG TPA: hypothetical protein DCY13_22635, partial [Verrucomicrobiales bacterium]|nr:hypothetical protein [Verrucomicrobiales bacterium]
TDTGRLRPFGFAERWQLAAPDPFDLFGNPDVELPAGLTGALDFVMSFGWMQVLGNDYLPYYVIVPWRPNDLGKPITLQPMYTSGNGPNFVALDSLVDTNGAVWLSDRVFGRRLRVDFGGLPARESATIRTYNQRMETVAFLLMADGSLWQSGGDGNFGTTGTLAPTDMAGLHARRTAFPEGVAGWRDIAGAFDNLLALSWEGKLFALGYNQYGQLGQGDRNPRWMLTEVPVPTGASRWLRVAFSGSHALALADDGRVYAWGANGSGQLGLGHIDSVESPTPIAWFGDLRRPEATLPAPEVDNYPPYGSLRLTADISHYLTRPMTLDVWAEDPDGEVASVEFFRDGLSLGVATNRSSVGSFRLATHVNSGGTWTFQARMTDQEGLSAWTEPLVHTYLDNQPRRTLLVMVPNKISVRRGDPTPAELILTRDSRTNLALTVPLEISGTATPGVDYDPLPASVTFPPGVLAVTLTIVTHDHTPGEPNESILIRPSPSGCAFNDYHGEGCYDSFDISTGGVYILPPPRPVISMEMTDYLAIEGEDNHGLFRFVRTVETNRPVSVRFHYRGGLDPATDLESFPETIEFAAGQTEVLLPLVPRFDFDVEGQEWLLFIISPGDCSAGEGDPGCYEVGSPAAGTIYLLDGPKSDLPVVNVLAPDPVAIEGTTNTAIIRFTRSGSSVHALDIGLQVSGTAEPGVDFSFAPATVRIEAGEVETDLVITALPDQPEERVEYVTIDLLAPPCFDELVPEGCYRLGATTQVRAFVLDPASFPPLPGAASLAGATLATTIHTKAVLFDEITRRDGEVILRIAGDPGVRFELEASDDLLGWHSLGEHTIADGHLTWREPAGTATRYFRLVPRP